jgi:hypothetical protein
VKKLLIIVTITSVRPQQAYYLNRLAHVLKAVQAPLLWLVVEWPEQSYETAEILRSSGVMYRHLICRKNTTSVRKIAVCQRNNAIYHVKKHHLDGIMHFADEERSYSADVFEEMQKIRSEQPHFFFAVPMIHNKLFEKFIDAILYRYYSFSPLA